MNHVQIAWVERVDPINPDEIRRSTRGSRGRDIRPDSVLAFFCAATSLSPLSLSGSKPPMPMLSALGAYTRTVTFPSGLTSGETKLGFGLFRAARQAVSHPSSAPMGFPCAKTSDARASAKAESTTINRSFIALLPASDRAE